MDEFIKISKYAGMREDLVQAGGGNSSVKLSNNRLVIKASGYQLTEVSNDFGYSIVDSDYIKKTLAEVDLSDISDYDVEQIIRKGTVEGTKPSIEVFLHVFLRKYTLHTHPTLVNVLMCRNDWKDITEKMFPEAYYVSYASPGIDLAKAYFETVKSATDDVVIVFLKNHGLVVSCEEPENVIRNTEDVLNVIADFLGVSQHPFSISTEIWKLFPDKIVWRVKDSNVRDAYLEMGDFWNYKFCPDCLVYLGKEIYHYSLGDKHELLEAFKKNYGMPTVVECNDDFFIVADSLKKAREIESVLSFSAQVAIINKGKKIDYLSDAEQDKLLSRKDEKYRRTV